ncbi:hypothetical protein VTJ83DRAFT_7550 [Remersonia thermophila]|uniref:CFEM domain-containing protein n=1 Tax=Remersonia thermophila TaxID=72144 RepID=A0ABR4D3Z6_9PEZI
MVRISTLAALSLAAVASAQTIDSLDPCGQTCWQNALNNAGAVACAAMDMNCLCPNVDFHNSINDCSLNACPPGYATTVVNAARVHCAAVAPDVGLPPPPPPPEPPAEPAPPPETPPETPTEAPAETPTPTPETPETSTNEPPAPTTTNESTSEPAAAPTTTSPAETKGASPTTETAPDATTTEEPSEEPASGGLGEAAKIGIGVGVSAVVIALAAVVAWFMLRRRRDSSPPASRFNISGPMPNSEHAHTYHTNNSEYDIGDLEMKSRRYEDMLPREEPRQMV